MQRTPIRFALIGCGGIARKHAQVIRTQLRDARLAAVCDIFLPRAEAFASENGSVRAFETCEQMMETMGDEIDVVVILTPPGMHASGAIQAAELGCKNVVVEKPLALSVADAEDVIEACESHGARLFVVKQNRYNKPVQALRTALKTGRFNKIVSGTARVRWCRTAEYYASGKWRGTWEMDGGVFSNQAVHHLDLLTWLLGDVESVFAYTARRLASIEAEDTGAAVMRFTNGAIGLIEATTAARPTSIGASISVLGESGAAEIGGFAADQLSMWQFYDPHPDDDSVWKELGQNPSDVFAYAHAAYLQDVVDCIREDRQPTVGGDEGLRSVRLLNAIYESAETGREVVMANFSGALSPLGRRAVAV